VDGFSVGAHGDEADEAVPYETLGVLLDGGDVEVFGFGVEEGHGGRVDAAWERPPGGPAAIGSAVAHSHDGIGGRNGMRGDAGKEEGKEEVEIPGTVKSKWEKIRMPGKGGRNGKSGRMTAYNRNRGVP